MPDTITYNDFVQIIAQLDYANSEPRMADIPVPNWAWYFDTSPRKETDMTQWVKIHGMDYEVSPMFCKNCADYYNGGCDGAPHCHAPTMRAGRLRSYKEAFELAATNANMTPFEYAAYLFDLQNEEGE